MKLSRLIPALALAGAASCALAASATAAPASSATVTSNWSGYVIGAKGNEPFSRVSGSWVEPATNCTAGPGYSSFWVGLGGTEQQSQALEQVGTSADCGSDASASHFAWYELLPAAPVRLKMSISPGDHISASVNVRGTAVTVSLVDRTTGASFTKTLQMDDPDTSTAEWIAEAPSACDGSGNCQPLPLSDFGTVEFTHTSATAGDHTGSISDRVWSVQPVALDSAVSDYSGGFVSTGTTAGATPSALSADGSSFSVTTSGGDQPSVPAGLYRGSAGGDGQGPIVVWIYG